RQITLPDRKICSNPAFRRLSNKAWFAVSQYTTVSAPGREKRRNLPPLLGNLKKSVFAAEKHLHFAFPCGTLIIAFVR
ncbi:hypothetical protein, partial [uncultured Oscillibacter sp.]|uniref:hypothetical protein n=1 Tax=uncultured Oscillibacter sp. TaxID=876091 RepID=UPI00260F8C01